MKCKYCGKEVGEPYSELETHLWEKHREIMLRSLETHVLKEGDAKDE